MSLWVSKKEEVKVEPFGCCCGVRLIESKKEELQIFLINSVLYDILCRKHPPNQI